MPLDRRSLVNRHNPVLRAADPFSPLSVGNGEFAFTADVTGLQSFPKAYADGIPLCTQAQWGWHTAPFSDDQFRFNRKQFRDTVYQSGGRTVAYPTGAVGQEKAYRWLRENPHRLHLGRIGLELSLPDGRPAGLSDLAGIEQTLDLWQGTIDSRFTLAGRAVHTLTVCHPEADAVSFQIQSELIALGRLWVRIAFPYAAPGISAADWESDGRHATDVVSENPGAAVLGRTLDRDRYFVSLAHPGAVLRREGRNAFAIVPSPRSDQLELTALFTPNPPTGPATAFSDCAAGSRRYWEGFWNSGGAVELAGSRDERAGELERRIVLSQYLTAIQCSGTLPPQETGLTCNSWYGKFHLEMHWWHAAHFALWGRTALLEKSLGWYRSLLPQARAAAGQGWRGARWPKMTSREGGESPSPINPLIIWQQPHPIYLAELIYRSRPDKETLARYRDLVMETAEFMASFALFDEENDRYCLAPPIVPAQENHPPEQVLNPTFELEYWRFGLQTAALWRERLGLKPQDEWAKVAAKLARLPVKGGLYAAHEGCADTFEKFNFDHPSMLGACGFLPGRAVDRDIMTRTLKKVIDSWQLDRVWGWDFPLIAMTAARLGQPETAVDALFIPSPQNVFLPNGHNRQAPGSGLPVYLPGNGALLAVVGLMAAGWDGSSDRNAPGFPADGRWQVAWEKLRPLP